MHASKQAASITSGANAEVHILFLYEAHLEVPGHTFIQRSFCNTKLYSAIEINECI